MRPTLSRILVPTDFSVSSDAALEYGKLLAEEFGATLHLLHVIDDPLTAGGWGSEAYLAELPRLREATQQDAEARLARSFTAAERDRLRISTEIADGRPARAIVDIGRQRGADLIVMGTHGRTGVAHLLLGSVTEKVLRTASCPVLAVKTPEQEADVAGSRLSA